MLFHISLVSSDIERQVSSEEPGEETLGAVPAAAHQYGRTARAPHTQV